MHELCAPFDVELAECLAKVVVDRVRADKKLSGDLSVGATFRREPSDLPLLRSELVSRIRRPSPETLTHHQVMSGVAREVAVSQEYVRSPSSNLSCFNKILPRGGWEHGI